MKLSDFLSCIVFGSTLSVFCADDVIYDGEKPLVFSDSFGSYNVYKIIASGSDFLVYVSQ